MKHIYVLFFLIIALLATNSANAQSNSDDTTHHGVVLHADARIAMLVKKHTDVKLGVIRSGRGFRVQIYSGSDRAVATQRKIDFVRRFPSVRSYMSYNAPSYRVKVGNFRSRGDAQEFYNQVSRLYNPCMIVPDIIDINTLHND